MSDDILRRAVDQIHARDRAKVERIGAAEEEEAPADVNQELRGQWAQIRARDRANVERTFGTAEDKDAEDVDINAVMNEALRRVTKRTSPQDE